MTPIRFALPCAVLLAASVAVATAATLPAPLSTGLFPFPAAVLGPADAASAGVGMADRFVGDEPFDNPAAATGLGFRLTPQIALTSRQDLHAANRELDDGGPVFDVGGARASAVVRGLSLSLYVSQPVLRTDNVSWIVGRTLPVSGSPAAVSIDATAREMRAGLAVSHAAFGGRVGVAGEWVNRDDTYERKEVSGSPDAGTTHAEFSGSGVAAAVGGRWERDPDAMWGWTAGASLRWNGELSTDGTATADQVGGASRTSFTATRASGVEGGAGVRVTVGRGVRALASFGGASAREWDGFGLSPGAQAEVRLAVDLRDPDGPWTARLGVGQEQMPGTNEYRAGHVAIGFGWVDGDMTVDAAVMRRTTTRGNEPNSHDDRGVVSVGFHF